MVGSSAPQADNSTMSVKQIGTSFRMSQRSLSMEAVVSSALMKCAMSLTERDSALRTNEVTVSTPGGLVVPRLL